MKAEIRSLFVTALLFGVVLLLAGCAVPVAAPEGAGAGAGEAVELTFWNMPFVTQEVSPTYVAQWEENVQTAVPNAQVDNFYGPGGYTEQRERFLLQAESGTPDVIEGLLEDTAAYVQAGSIEPLDAYFEAWEDADMFVPSTLEPLRINGQLYGIPYNTNARALVYRTDLFEEAGLAVPATWDEMLAAARTITEMTDGETHGIFVCTEIGDPRAAQEFISWYYQVSGGENMFSVAEDGSVTYNATVEQLEQVLGLYDELFTGEFPAADPDQRGTGWPVEDPGYVQGQWAMAPMGPWLWGRREEGDLQKDILENRTGITALPIPEGGTPATYLEVKPIMMSSYAEDKDATWELIKFITSRDQMGLWLSDTGGIPARTDSLEMPEFTETDIGVWLQGFADQLPIAVAQAPINWGPVSEANLRAVNSVIYDEMDPAEAAQWLFDRVNELNANGEL
jgi:ABC-type glycerol-3-phosphate transport system substrate-binding protein